MADDEKSLLEKYEFEEEVSEEFLSTNFGAYVKTGYPKPMRRLRMIYESQRASIEETYFWVLNACKQDFGFGNVIKTIDTFSASENSSFWGVTEQRKGIQQDRASQYLATIGKMTKELFQIVREIRILKERIELYDGVNKGKQADDVALKSYWADMVDGGTKGQMNVYQMAQQVGFGTLPDLFFSIFIKDDDDVSSAVEKKAGEFNEKVKSVLKQKLAKYMAWKKHTESEIRNRERFTLRYLRQHWAAIRMYISWIKPYLRNVQKLQTPDKYDRNPELISSFEGALMEIEFIARKASKNGGPAATILATFQYRVKPEMQFHAEGYQHKGPVHIGRIEFSLRSYGWSEKEVKKYMEYREQETLNLIGMVDESLGDAMDALGDELRRYLKEAGEELPPLKNEPEQEKKAEPPKMSVFEPITALFGGFKDIFMLPGEPIIDMFKNTFKKEDDGPKRTGVGDKKAAAHAAGMSFQVYKNYKKSHGMPAW